MNERQSEQTAQPATSPALTPQDQALLAGIAAARARAEKFYGRVLIDPDDLAVFLAQRANAPAPPAQAVRQ